MLEDAPLERAKLGRGLEAELVERVAGLAVRGERVGLASGAVKRDDALPLQPLAVRVCGDESFELADQRRMPARSEIEVDTGLEHRQAALVEPRSGGLRERLVGKVCERGATPERKRLAHLVCAALGEPLETLDVELVRLHADEIAGRTRHDPVGAERGAQRVHVHLERVLRRWRAATRPRSRRSAGRWRRLRSAGGAAGPAARAVSGRRAAPARHRRRGPPTAPTSGIPRPLRPPPALLKRSLGGS